jgi:fructose-1,6-bisphosphatase II
MKALHLEIIRATEAAAIASSSWVGRGDKVAADNAATEAMAARLNSIDFAGKVVIGEGKKDGAPGLFTGDCLGLNWNTKGTPIFDIAVDPLDGTTQTSKGGPEAMSVLAVGNEGSLLESEGWYMKKLAYGPKIKAKANINILDTLKLTLLKAANALEKDISKLTVCVLDRPRHSSIILDLRLFGCRIKLIQDCDVSAAIATAIPDSGIDLYMGVGGAPEGVIGAAALKCLRGGFQGMMCDNAGSVYDSKVLEMEDLAKGDVIFCATGVTDGP